MDISNVTGPSTIDLNELAMLKNLQYLRVRGNYMTGAVLFNALLCF
jgi:hypothetical protein